MKRLIVIPRWAGSSHDDWYPWLQSQLAADDAGYEIHILDIPDWNAPDVADSVDFLLKYLPADQLDTDTVLVGHSVGCQLIIRYLAHVEAEARRAGRAVPQVGGVLCVAGWFSVDQPWETVLNWIHLPVDYAAARRTIPPGKLVVLLSNDDPYTADYRENERLWVEQMQAEVQILPEKQHFGEALDPDVLAAIRDLATAAPTPS